MGIWDRHDVSNLVLKLFDSALSMLLILIGVDLFIFMLEFGLYCTNLN